MSGGGGAQAYTPRELRLLLTCLMLALLLVAFNQTILSTALPTIAGDLGGVDHLAWVIAGFVLTSTVSMPVYGSLSDALGRKILLLVAVGIFVIGSAAAAIAPTMELLILARLVQGLGGGGLLVLPQTILADAVPARRRAQYAGVFGAVWAVASVLGPLLGGWFTDGPGWSWSFWINLPIGALAAVLTLLFVKETPRPAVRPRPDVAGIALLLAATTCIVLLSTWAGTALPWDSPVVLGLLGATLVSIAGFVAAEARAAAPIMPLELFRNRDFVLATAASTLTAGVGMFAVITFLPVYLQMAKGLGAVEAGLVLIPLIGSILISSALTGVLVTRTGRYKLLTVAGTLVSAIALWLLAGADRSSAVLLVAAYSALLGLGLGTIVQLLLLVVQNAVPSRIVGSATAAANYFRQAGAAVGIAAVGGLFTARLGVELGRLPGDPLSAIEVGSLTPSLVSMLSESQRDAIASAYEFALPPTFLILVPLALASAFMLCLLRRTPLA